MNIHFLHFATSKQSLHEFHCPQIVPCDRFEPELTEADSDHCLARVRAFLKALGWNCQTLGKNVFFLSPLLSLHDLFVFLLFFRF